MDQKRRWTARSSVISRSNSSKKGQVTVFIILGIILLLALALIIALRSEVLTFRPAELIPTEKNKVENFLTSCINDAGEEALFTLGLQAGYVDIPEARLADSNTYLRTSPFTVIPYWAYGTNIDIPSLDEIKLEIDQYIEEQVRPCLLQTEAFRENYDIVEKSDLLADTRIEDQKILFNVHWEVEIRNKAGDVIAEVTEHTAESPIKLKKAYETAALLIEKEMQTLKLEDITQDLIALEHPDVPVAGMDLSCRRKEWDVHEVKSALVRLLRINIPELKVQGTDYVEFPDTLPYYQNHYVWDVGEEFEQPDLHVDFNFEERYPFTFAVTPLSGTKMKSSQLGGTDLLSFLCLQTWKFTYDVVYPVVVRIQDETTGYNFNIAFTVHLIRNVPNRGEVVARPSYMIDTITDEDYCKIRNIPMSVYTYELVENEITGVHQREPLANVNTSFTCLRYKCDAGTTKYQLALLGDRAGYTQNFPYCVGGILRGTKPGYKESWERVVTQAGTEVELDLVPLYSFPVQNIKVVQHELNNDNTAGPARALGKTEAALVKVTLHKSTDVPGTAFHEVSFTKSGRLDPRVEGEETVELLAQADFTYQVDISVLDDERFLGGYKGNWTIPWEELQNAPEITFHVISKENMDEEEMYQLLLGLDDYSALVPAPEIKG